ncbi:MAG: hypothetical protein WBZ45_07090 [Acidimicrobiia bacterium]
MTEGATRTDSFAMLKRYSTLSYGAFGTMADIGLMVLGSLLVGLAVSVLLAGFGVVNVEQDLSTASMLGSALILAVIGLFALGVAAEGPLGRGRRLIGFKIWEVGIGRTLAVLLVGFLGLLAFGALDGAVDGFPAPLIQAVQGLRAVSIAGMVAMPLVGIPLAILARWYPNGPDWLGRTDIPIMFVVWAVATMIIVT